MIIFSRANTMSIKARLCVFFTFFLLYQIIIATTKSTAAAINANCIATAVLVGHFLQACICL